MNEIKTSTDQRNFSMIYHDFLDSDFLDSYEKMIFIYLKRFADTEGKCFPSINKLAKVSKFSKSTILRILKSLEEKKVISIEHRKTDKGNKSNIYTLYDYAGTWQKKELSHATATDAQESQHKYKIDNIDNKTAEIESQEEKLQCADSKNIENADIEKNKEVKASEEKRAEQEEREKDQNGSGIESVNTLAAYETLIKNNIAYADLCNSHQYDVKFIDEIVSNILDVVMSEKKKITVAGEQKNIELVKSVLLKLNYYQIEYVIEKYKQITTKITNKRQYILTMLYNARLESESDVINEVAHDLSVLPLQSTRDREKDIKNLANYLL